MQEPPVQRQRIVVDDSALAGRIGERIRQARLQAGMTQQQLAEGRYTKAYISALESERASSSTIREFPVGGTGWYVMDA